MVRPPVSPRSNVKFLGAYIKSIEKLNVELRLYKVNERFVYYLDTANKEYMCLKERNIRWDKPVYVVTKAYESGVIHRFLTNYIPK